MADTFAELNVTDTLASAAEAIGFSKPTELQERLLPMVQGGANVLVCANGGSGRTLGYLLPMMERLLGHEPREGRGPRSLILSPSRDTAMKTGRMIKSVAQTSHLRFGTVVGGRPYPMQHQLLRRPLDLLVATPARLMDHMRRGRVPFERLEILVVDGVDELFETGFESELDFVVDAVAGESLQTVLLAGRMSADVEALSARVQPDAQRIELVAAPPAVQGEEIAAEAEKKTPADKPRGRGRNVRSNTRSRRPRGANKNNATPQGEVNGNVAEPAGNAARAGQGKTRKGKAKSAPKRAPTGNAAGTARGQNRRTGGGQGRRKPQVHFPSDYANGPHQPKSPAEAVEQHREVKRHEPMQYLADYGFSSGSKANKPVTVVYRNKHRKPLHRDDEGNDGNGDSDA
ncbi:DEAD/DEAH box helicase family protein [Acidihalobacter ferrooxydans]|uniref:DEAD/DEAH box helicase family protein n=1 Tax=Acidihalobacter ferrooxydans TaxID=1765967 RepID=UPI0018DD2D86|nr:DEAD/DEAH box helicase [Acidihalobacter ferrooxydans]